MQPEGYQGSTHVFIPASAVSPRPAFEIRRVDGRRILYLPTAQSVSLIQADVTDSSAMLAADTGLLRGMSDESWLHFRQEYIAAVESVNAALWRSRVQGFVYTEDFFVGYYLALRMWQTLMMQLELRMRVLSDENLVWLSRTIKAQYDTGMIDIPREGPVASFGSFVIPMPETPKLNAAEVRIGSTVGQWRSLIQFMTLLADRGFRLLTWEFIIDYCFECRHELAMMIEDKQLSFRKIMQLGDAVIRDAGAI